MKKRRQFFMGLDVQMMTFFVFATLIFLLVASSFYYQRTFSMLRRDSERFHIHSMQQSRRWISQALDEVDRVTSILAHGNVGQKVLGHSEKKRDSETALLYNEFLQEIHNILINYPFLNSIYFYTNDGIQIGANQNHTCVNLSASSYSFVSQEVGNSKSWKIIGGLKEDFFNPLFNLSEKNPGLITMIKREPVLYSGFIHGYIAVNIREEVLFDYYRTDLPNEELFLLNADMQIISSEKKSIIGQTYNNFGKLNFKRDYSSVMTDNQGIPCLNLSYRIPNTELWLVDQIQLNDLAASSRDIIWMITLTMFIGSLLLLLIVSIWLRRKLRPLRELVTKMNDIQYGKFGSTFRKIPRNEFGILIKKFNEMSLSITQLMQKNEQIYQQKTEQELLALQAQLNPHFIYNTLNMIKWMAVMDGANNIVECITTLGCLLEPVFKSSGGFWKLENEIDYLQNYIKIMGWRYGNTCTVECLIPAECAEQSIPRFILQPIIENSVTHGIPKEKAIHIVISCEKQPGMIVLCVQDNGSSISPERLEEIKNMLQNDSARPNTSVGLFNVNRRIKLNFGNEYGLDIESRQGCGTSVTLTLPIVQSPNPSENISGEKEISEVSSGNQ